MITTINPPTAQVSAWRKIAKESNEVVKLIVVGDEKAPHEAWHRWIKSERGGDVCYVFPNGTYTYGGATIDGNRVETRFLFAEAQRKNHYSLKNLGYVLAARFGCHVFETDDDNAPTTHWWPVVGRALGRMTRSANSQSGCEVGVRVGGVEWCNVYDRALYQPRDDTQLVWPRGYPLPARDHDVKPLAEPPPTSCGDVRVIQFMHDGECDLDAVGRLSWPRATETCNWVNQDWLHTVLEPGTWAPFNSQATLWHRDVLKHAYIPNETTTRASDIVRGYIALRMLWNDGYTLGFGPAATIQTRNPHNLVSDMESELPLYAHAHRVPGLLRTESSFELCVAALAEGGDRPLVDNYVGEVSRQKLYVQAIEQGLAFNAGLSAG